MMSVNESTYLEFSIVIGRKKMRQTRGKMKRKKERYKEKKNNEEKTLARISSS